MRVCESCQERYDDEDLIYDPNVITCRWCRVPWDITDYPEILGENEVTVQDRGGYRRIRNKIRIAGIDETAHAIYVDEIENRLTKIAPKHGARSQYSRDPTGKRSVSYQSPHPEPRRYRTWPTLPNGDHLVVVGAQKGAQTSTLLETWMGEWHELNAFYERQCDVPDETDVVEL
jgi:hypothetical protein